MKEEDINEIYVHDSKIYLKGKDAQPFEFNEDIADSFVKSETVQHLTLTLKESLASKKNFKYSSLDLETRNVFEKIVNESNR